ncbi:MAG: plastocyanin/azurin family copper-binding protein [Ilumatobacteraceae bacterium]
MRVNVLKRVAVSAAMVAALGACGGDSDDSSDATSNSITGNLNEWTVETDATTAKAGEVVFTVTNDGTIGHEFLVVKTDIAAGEIPLDGDHFAEPTDGMEVIDEIGEFAKGTTETLTLTLDPGTYQLVCNLPGHYSAGMFTTLTVVS